MNLKQELWRQYRHNQAQLHPLRTLFWECTLRCNMHCRHCGSDCKVSTTTPDMPAKDFFKAIDDITPHVDPHKVFVIFTGGEALLRPDIEACGLELYRRGYPWGMVSNGFLLDEKRLDRLLSSGMHSITISLDGLEAEHDWMRQTQGGFARASRAIQLLGKTPDILWDVVTCVNPRNYHQLEAIKDYLLSLGCRRWRLFAIFPMGRAAHDPELQLSDEQFTGVLDFVKHTREEGKIICSYACEGYNLHQGNIYKDNLWDVWENRFQPYRDRSWMRKGQCKECKVWRYCEGNGMHLYDDKGDLLSCSLHRIIGQK